MEWQIAQVLFFFFFTAMEEKHSSKDLASRIAETAEGVTTSPAEVDRLLNNPIDILCFGRAGVGKTTLLEGVTRRDLGSTPRLDHGTRSLECISILEEVPLADGRSKSVHIRFWDTKGIDKWSGEDLPNMFKELEEQSAKPICVYYCTTGNGRVDTAIVKGVLQHFHDSGVIVFWLVTNMFSMNDEQMESQLEEGLQMLREITGEEDKPITSDGLFSADPKDAYRIGGRAFVLAVNSKPYASQRSGVTKQTENINLLMRLCIDNLNSDQVAQYFIATLHNRDFWQMSADRLGDIIHSLQKVGVDMKGWFEHLWSIGWEVVKNILGW